MATGINQLKSHTKKKSTIIWNHRESLCNFAMSDWMKFSINALVSMRNFESHFKPQALFLISKFNVQILKLLLHTTKDRVIFYTMAWIPISYQNMSESAKLCLDRSNTIYFTVSIVTTNVVGKYQGKSRCCMYLLMWTKYYPPNNWVIYWQLMPVDTIKNHVTTYFAIALLEVWFTSNDTLFLCHNTCFDNESLTCASRVMNYVHCL